MRLKCCPRPPARLLQLGEPARQEEALDALRHAGVRMTKVAPNSPKGYATAGRAAMDQASAGLAHRCVAGTGLHCRPIAGSRKLA